jgi:hypothetical protein
MLQFFKGTQFPQDWKNSETIQLHIANMYWLGPQYNQSVNIKYTGTWTEPAPVCYRGTKCYHSQNVN